MSGKTEPWQHTGIVTLFSITENVIEYVNNKVHVLIQISY